MGLSCIKGAKNSAGDVFVFRVRCYKVPCSIYSELGQEHPTVRYCPSYADTIGLYKCLRSEGWAEMTDNELDMWKETLLCI
jgi:hypothetical protein